MFGESKYIFGRQDFHFYYMFKKIFSAHKIWGDKKFEVDCPRMSPVATGMTTTHELAADRNRLQILYVTTGNTLAGRT